MLTLVSMRGLEQSTGISKSEANNVLNRCITAGLAKLGRNNCEASPIES